MSRLLQSFRVFFAGSLAKQAGRFLHGYFGALVLGPTLFGLWRGVRLVLDYGMYANMGAIYGMERQIPFYKGRGDLDRVRETESAVFTFNLIMTTMLSAGVALAGVLTTGSTPLKLSLMFVAAILWARLVQEYFGFKMRAHGEFPRLAWVGLADFFCSLVAIGLVFAGGLAGFLAGFLLRAVATLVLIARIMPHRERLHWNWPVLRETLIFGVPLMLGGLVFLAFQSIDRIVILGFLDLQQLGFYSLGTLILMPLRMAVNTAINVLFPSMTEAYARSGEVASTAPFVLKPLALLAYAGPVMVGWVHLLLPTLVPLVLPQYSAGILAATILIYGLVFSYYQTLLDRFWVTLGRQRQIVYMVLFGCVAKVVFCYVFLRAGLGIVGVALASTVAYALVFAVMAAISFSLLALPWARVIGLFGRIFLAVIYMAAVGQILVRWMPTVDLPAAQKVLQVGRQHLGFALAVAPLVFLAYREIGHERFRELLNWR